MGGKPSSEIPNCITCRLCSPPIKDNDCLDKKRFNQLMNIIIENNEPTFKDNIEDIAIEFIHNTKAYLKQTSRMHKIAMIDS